MDFILYTTAIALFYYLILLFTANKWVLNKFKNPANIDSNGFSTTAQMVLALNINIICSLFIVHDNVMNYVTFLIGDEASFFNFLSSGAIIILLNIAALGISYLLSKLFSDFIGKDSPVFTRPILWITINLLLLKLTTLYYEAYISTQNFTIL
ncbi:hypothetical protein D9O36_20975 [Zobellia amurskyensis]|uniref:Uncharacterized protein n=1 Tax=Zobellia amurskyensis TaxID=248905 RepID=A0A7X2ZXP8_9FLAO|nr:hypothetical protein [Zobellia amurskyensis]MUH38325.1 hypothetical protein [Zobellia amurskyensis]